MNYWYCIYAIGYDDDSILEMLAEEEVIETRHRPHQQREGWRGVSSSIRGGGGGGSTPVSSATNPPHPPLVPDSIHWKEDDYDSQASSSSLGRRGRGRTAESSRHSFQPTSAVTASSSAEPRKASAASSRLSHHLIPSVSPTNDHRHVQPKRHKTPVSIVSYILYSVTTICLSVCLYVCMSVCLYVCLSVCSSIHPSIHPSIHSSTHTSIHPSIQSASQSSSNLCLYACVYVCMSVCLSVRLSVHPSIHPPN